jgi:hypothetical protein
MVKKTSPGLEFGLGFGSVLVYRVVVLLVVRELTADIKHCGL